jgi:hypothetical protein
MFVAYRTTTTGWGKTYPRAYTSSLEDLSNEQLTALRNGETVVIHKITGGKDVYEPMTC